MSTPKTLYETERLIVRQLDENDTGAMHAVYGDREAMKFTGGILTYEECVGWVKITQRNYAQRGYGMSAVLLKETGEIIGFIGMIHDKSVENAPPEVKYSFLKSAWGKGIATEATIGMLAYGAKAHNMQRIIATVDGEHKASQRVMQKAGMTYHSSETEEDGKIVQTYEYFSDC